MNALWIDGLVVLTYFVVIITIGLRVGREDQSMRSFAIGDRNIPWWAVLASILAAEISAATFLGAPGEGYEMRNFTYAQLALGTILARVIIAAVFIKPFYDYRVISIYEYLSLRFGRKTRNAASAIFLVTRALASGTRLYVAAIVLVMAYELFTGTSLQPLDQVAVYCVALFILTCVTAIYTAAGGIKAVVWTDLIQASLMFGSLGFAIWKILQSIPNGWQGVTAALTGPKDFALVDFGITPGAGFAANLRSILGLTNTNAGSLSNICLFNRTRLGSSASGRYMAAQYTLASGNTNTNTVGTFLTNLREYTTNTIGTNGVLATNYLPQIINLKISQKPFQESIIYDPLLGYPSSVYFDMDERIADEEIGYIIENLVKE